MKDNPLLMKAVSIAEALGGGRVEDMNEARHMTALGRLARLVKITDHLEQFPFESLAHRVQGGLSGVDVLAGNLTMISMGPGNDPAFSAALCFSSAGTVLPRHTHIEVEIIVCVEGEMQVIFDNDEECRTLRDRDFIRVEPGRAHSCVYPVDTKSIAIVMPASPAFPGKAE